MEEINYLLSFQDNWDGEGAHKLNIRVYENLMKLIEINPNIFDGADLCLNVNGSVYLTKNDLMMNIGSHTYSCIPENYESREFNPVEVSEIILSHSLDNWLDKSLRDLNCK